MKNPLSLIKSTFHDIRCCDEVVKSVDGVTLAWRALVSSVSCVLDAQGGKTGYATVATLEEYDTSTSAPTGKQKVNSPSDGNYIPDYIDHDNCSVTVEPTTAIAYNFNGCSGHLAVQLILESDRSVVFNYDVNPSASLNKTVPPGLYEITLFCPQDQPPGPAPALHVAMTVNSKFSVVATEALQLFHHIQTPINISVRPTTQATTGGGGL
jgi:hypothetical protein